MSTLVLDEMYPGIEFTQKIKINRNINVVHIRPWIYLQGTLVDGDFQIEVLQDATVLETKQINYMDINDVKTDTYAHGFIRFDFSSLALQILEGNVEQEYTFRFTMQNHTKDTENFLGVVRNWDVAIYPVYGEGVSDMIQPAGLEIYEVRIT